MTGLLHDARAAVRSFTRTPLLAAAVVVTMALGIGATTAVFSVVKAVLLAGLPYPRPDRLVLLNETNPQVGQMSVAWPNFLDWRERSRSFTAMAAYQPDGFSLTTPDGPVRARGARISAELLTILGIRPERGRDLAAEDDRVGAAPVVLLAHGAWQRRFGADAGVVGRTLTIDGTVHTIVGVLPREFRLLDDTEELYLPAGLSGDDEGWLNRGNHFGHVVVARLRPGVTRGGAIAEMSAIARQLEREYPSTNGGQGVEFASLREIRTGDARRPLLVLLAAVALVLLIACANVAGLLLAAGAGRARELAIRAALGASRRRLVRQLLIESVALASTGGAAGVVLALLGVAPLVALAPTDVPGLRDVRLDVGVLGFAAVLSVLTGVLFGLAPALQAARFQPQPALKDEGRGVTTSRPRQRLRAALLAAQVALALVLLAGAGLMVRTMGRLADVDPGFVPGRVLAADVQLLPHYDSGATRRVFFADVLERVRALPGVTAAAAAVCVPVRGACWGSVYLVEGRPVPAPGELPSAAFNAVTPEYFETMGIPVLRGRAFADGDGPDAPPVVVVNETMARLHWPGESPLGKRIKQGFPEDDVPFREIVGIARDVPRDGLDAVPRPEVYLPYAQQSISFVTLLARTETDPAALSEPLRAAVAEVDPGQPLDNVQPMTRYLAESVARRRFVTSLLAIFAGVALILASVGVYGVVAHGAGQRRGEIGIRLALGARASHVLSLLVGHGMRPVFVGLVLGVAGAFAVTRLLSALLFGIAPTDAVTFAVVSALLASVALVACWIPARRALALDPLAALRHE